MTLHLTYPNGYVAINNNLEILLLNRALSNIKSSILYSASKLKEDMHDDALDPDEWRREAIHLCNIAENIMSNDSKIDIFDYLPLTKEGNFSNEPIVIAESSTYSGAIHYIDSDHAYPVIKRLQIRLTPVGKDTHIILDGSSLDYTTIENAMLMTIDIFNAQDSEPILDEFGAPIKSHTKYLDDVEIMPGHLYEDRFGKRWLCITGCDFKITKTMYLASGRILKSPSNYALHNKYAYIKYTTELEKEIGIDNSFNAIMRVLAAQDNGYSIVKRIRVSSNPKKFIKEIATVFPVTYKSSNIVGAKHKDPHRYDSENQFIYDIEPYLPF